MYKFILLTLPLLPLIGCGSSANGYSPELATIQCNAAAQTYHKDATWISKCKTDPEKFSDAADAEILPKAHPRFVCMKAKFSIIEDKLANQTLKDRKINCTPYMGQLASMYAENQSTYMLCSLWYSNLAPNRDAYNAFQKEIGKRNLDCYKVLELEAKKDAYQEQLQQNRRNAILQNMNTRSVNCTSQAIGTMAYTNCY